MGGLLGCPRKLGSMVITYNLLINGVHWAYNPLILTIDPNFQRDIQVTYYPNISDGKNNGENPTQEVPALEGRGYDGYVIDPRWFDASCNICPKNHGWSTNPPQKLPPSEIRV